MRPSAYDGEETRRRLVGTARLQDLHHVWAWRAAARAGNRAVAGQEYTRFLQIASDQPDRAARAGPAWPGPRRLAHYITSGPARTGG
jgi:hypothetical protein